MDDDDPVPDAYSEHISDIAKSLKSSLGENAEDEALEMAWASLPKRDFHTTRLWLRIAKAIRDN